MNKATLDRELTSVANTLHNGFLTILDKPGRLESNVANLLPDLCPYSDTCYNSDNSSLMPVEAIYQIEYYVRLLSPEGNPVAIALGKQEVRDWAIAIVIAIAQAHQGTIEVISELGVGSTFTVKLLYSPLSKGRAVSF